VEEVFTSRGCVQLCSLFSGFFFLDLDPTFHHRSRNGVSGAVTISQFTPFLPPQRPPLSGLPPFIIDKNPKNLAPILSSSVLPYSLVVFSFRLASGTRGTLLFLLFPFDGFPHSFLPGKLIDFSSPFTRFGILLLSCGYIP